MMLCVVEKPLQPRVVGALALRQRNAARGKERVVKEFVSVGWLVRREGLTSALDKSGDDKYASECISIKSTATLVPK